MVKHGHECKLQYTGAVKQMAKTGQIIREWPFGLVVHVFISTKRRLVIYSLYLKVQWMKCSRDFIFVNASCFAKFAKYSLTKIRAYAVLAKLQLLSSTQYHSFHVPAVKLLCQPYSSTFRMLSKLGVAMAVAAFCYYQLSEFKVPHRYFLQDDVT